MTRIYKNTYIPASDQWVNGTVALVLTVVGRVVVVVGFGEVVVVLVVVVVVGRSVVVVGFKVVAVVVGLRVVVVVVVGLGVVVLDVVGFTVVGVVVVVGKVVVLGGGCELVVAIGGFVEGTTMGRRNEDNYLYMNGFERPN